MADLELLTIAALIRLIGFWGILYYSFVNKMNNYLYYCGDPY